MSDAAQPSAPVAERALASAAVDPDRPALVLDLSEGLLLHATAAAARLAAAAATPEGALRPDWPAGDRLREWSRRGPVRSQERLRLGRLAPPMTCTVQVVDLDGRRLVVLIPGQADAPARPPNPAKEERAAVRFTWQSDAQGRFVQVSPPLAAVVGPGAADILGQTFAEAAGHVLRDPEDVAGCLSRRETFSGRVVFWRVDGSDREIPVDFAGAPVLGPQRAFAGFRGFGILRPGQSQIRPQRAPSPIVDETMLIVPAPVAPEPEQPPGREPEAPPQPETWFDSIRDLVTETLSNATAALHGRTASHTPADEPDMRPAAEVPTETETATETAAEVQPSPSTEVPSESAGVSAPAGESEGGAPAPASGDTRASRAASGLTSAERSAFREIARALGARFEDDAPPAPAEPPSPPSDIAARQPRAARPDAVEILEHLPVGVLVHRGEHVLFANRNLLDLADYEDVATLAEEGGVPRLFRGAPTLLRGGEGGAPFSLTTRRDESLPVEVRLSTIPWDGVPASVMTVRRLPEADLSRRIRQADQDLKLRDERVRELESILDTATDGVIVVDEAGRILSLNRSAEALFGYDEREVVGEAVTVLFAPESHVTALDYLEGLRAAGVASLLNDGREVLGRVRQGGVIPLFMTMGVANDGFAPKYCAVLRDITAFKKAESELISAKRAAEEASAQKSDLLAKISHEIRTPLSAIIGFAEVMLEERFGPIGNERYKEYLKDVHTSGAHVISLVNDLLDLAKIEAGRMDLSFTSVSLNELVGATVTLLQPQAARERIVMRTSFAQKLPTVIADERSIRQIVLNLVSNAIKFTDAGGQVIVSTALTDRGEVAFRVRDTGIGMTEAEIGQALEPFRQLATARRRGGTGLGLPLTKALVEANRGALQITSHPNEGTLVEVLFPPARVLAE